VFSNGAFATIYFFRDADLPAAAATSPGYGVSIAISGATGIVANVIELTGVDQIQTYDGDAVSHAQPNNCAVLPPSDPITVTSGQQSAIVIDVVGFVGGGGTGTAGPGQGKTLEDTSGSAHGIASYLFPVTGKATMSWSGKTCSTHVHAVAAFRRATN
jgi:hypothetical protein